MATTPDSPSPLPKDSPDDRSSYLHRQFIGWLGAFLPILIHTIAGCRPTKGLEDRALFTSVSAYYYSGAVAIFCGILFALAAYFFTYQGYDNKFGVLDRILSWIAGIAAVTVALFPTKAPICEVEPDWWAPAVGVIHVVSAMILFTAFTVFAVFLFPKTSIPKPPPTWDKILRDVIYYACGVVMVVSIGWALIAYVKGKPIFWQEVCALEAFALSWLTKGRAAKTVFAVIRHPKEVAAKVIQAVR